MAEYDSETDLCEEFADHARREGWTVYPECQGWDMILQWESTGGGAPFEEGDQVGVEAKTRANLKVLDQVLRHVRSGRVGPDWAAILLPDAPEEMGRVAGELGFPVWADPASWHPHPTTRYVRPDDGERLEFDASVWTPPVVPDVRPGQPSPSPLTPWRVKALKICAIMRARGWATTRDFERVDVTKRTFIRFRWMVRDWELEASEDLPEGYTAAYVPPWSGEQGTREENWEEFPDIGWEEEQLEIVESNPNDVPDEVVEEFLEGHPGDLEHPVAGHAKGNAGELARSILE